MGERDFPEEVLSMGQSLAWQDDANCKGKDGDIFFPERGASIRLAKGICRECKVREECLWFALITGQKAGIWGGMSERERRKARRKLHLAGTLKRKS